MDNIDIKSCQESFYNMGIHFMGSYAEKTGKDLFLIDSNKLDPEAIEFLKKYGVLTPIPKHNNVKDVMIQRSKDVFYAEKIEKLYKLFDSFMKFFYEPDPNSEIGSNNLMSMFKVNIDETEDISIDFPILMNRYLEENPNSGITKRLTSKGVVYEGIKFKEINYDDLSDDLSDDLDNDFRDGADLDKDSGSQH